VAPSAEAVPATEADFIPGQLGRDTEDASMIYVFGLAAFCVGWLLPGHYFPWHSFEQEVAAAIGALLLALAAVASADVRRLPLPRIAIAALVFAAVPMTQWFFGEVPFLADALLPGLYLCAFGLTIAVSMALARADGDRYVGALFGAILLGAFASIAIGLAQWLRLGPSPLMENLPQGDRVYANFTQPNQLAALVGMAIAPVAWLFETRRIGRWPAFLALWFLALGLVMTQARVGWLVVMMFLLWWWLAHTRAALRSTWPGVALAASIFVAMTLLWTRLNAALDSSTATALTERVQVIGGRSIHWPAMWDAAWRRPLAGWGWMQVGAAQRAVALDHPASHEWITYSHNVFLDLLVWNGLVIGALAIGAVVWWAAGRCLACRDAVTWSLLAAGGVIATYAMVEFPHAYLFFLLLLALVVGAAEARLAAADPVSGGITIPKWAFAATSTVMVGMLAWICLEYREVEEASRRTRLAEERYVVPGQEPRTPDVTLLDNQRDYLWLRLTEPREGMSEGDMERMRRVDQRYMTPAVLLRFATAAGLNGRPEEAKRNLQLICWIWKPKYCDEGRVSWGALQERFPKLRWIGFPGPAEIAAAGAEGE
jgi:hypothetical protein